MAEVLRIRTIRGWNKPQPELLAGFLHKVCELMYLKKRHERVQKTPLVSVHQANEGCPSRSHHRRVALGCFDLRGCPTVRSPEGLLHPELKNLQTRDSPSGQPRQCL